MERIVALDRLLSALELQWVTLEQWVCRGPADRFRGRLLAIDLGVAFERCGARCFIPWVGR